MTTRLETPAGADPEWTRRWLRAVGSHFPEAESRVTDEVDAHRWRGLARRIEWRIWQLPGRLHPVSRYFHRTSFYRSEPQAMLLWGAFGFASLLALVGFGALIGFGAKNVHLGAAIDSFASTVTQPAVAVPLAFVLLTTLAGCCRGARLGWLAWRPGPIVVPDFATFGELKDTTPAQVQRRAVPGRHPNQMAGLIPAQRAAESNSLTRSKSSGFPTAYSRLASPRPATPATCAREWRCSGMRSGTSERSVTELLTHTRSSDGGARRKRSGRCSERRQEIGWTGKRA